MYVHTSLSRARSLEDLAKFYLQGEAALLVFTECMHACTEEVGKLRAEVEEGNRQLQVLVNGLTAENLEMKSEMAKMELENTNLRRDMAKLEYNTKMRSDVTELQQGIVHVSRMVEKLVN